MKSFFLIFSLTVISFGALAQDSRNPEEKPAAPEIVFSAEQLQVMYKAFQEHPYNKYYDNLIVEYQKRMKANVKRREVIARKMEKPQYSDPSYFGHKRKPKKRPVGKRKFCKECEIVH